MFLQCFSRTSALLAHEYIHVLQYEGRGHSFELAYFAERASCGCSDERNAEEAVGWVWQFWENQFSFWEANPWNVWHRPPG